MWDINFFMFSDFKKKMSIEKTDLIRAWKCDIVFGKHSAKPVKSLSFSLGTSKRRHFAYKIYF